MNICFITAGPIEWGSSRMRAYWVAEALRERGHEVSIDQNSNEPWEGWVANTYIWQKTFNRQWFDETVQDTRHYWDVCDPSWWWQPNECREIARHMTGVVASSKALADDFNEWYGEDLAITIPDRLKLSYFHTQRQHRDVSPVRLVWFGIAANRVALWGARANLERLVANGHKIELTIFDDRPDIRFNFSDAFPIYHTQWELSTEVDVLSSHDVALLPPYPGPWGEVKSNNKTFTAWACGLPVVGDFTEYDMLESIVKRPETRQELGFGAGWDELIEEWEIDVCQSAVEWEALLS